jgi:hypothetical protein
VNIGSYLDVEPPVRRFMRPRRSGWTEFEFARVTVEPVGVFIDEMTGEISEKIGPGDEL